jgi:hypothetical protein
LNDAIDRAMQLALERRYDEAKAQLESADEPVAEQLYAFVTELDRQDDALRRQVTFARHDIGNALAIVQANLEGIIDGVIAPTPERLENMRTSLQNVGSLLDDLRLTLNRRLDAR